MTMAPKMNAYEMVAREFYVRLRYYDNQGEYDSLRIIMALDKDDAMEQVRDYANRENMYWYDVSIPSRIELEEIRQRFALERKEYFRKKGIVDEGGPLC